MTEGYFDVIKNTPKFIELKNKIYFDLSNKDLPLDKTIKKVVRDLGGNCSVQVFTRTIRIDGSLGDYTFTNFISYNYLDGDLNRFAEDLAMSVLKNQGYMLNESRRPRKNVSERLVARRPQIKRGRRSAK